MTDDDEDIKITPVQRAYLKAFDNWLHQSWKVHQRPHDDPATGLKDACFDDLMLEASSREPDDWSAPSLSWAA